MGHLARRWLHTLCAAPSVWRHCHDALFGDAPPADWSQPTVRRLCRRSELRAARWLEARPQVTAVGPLGTTALQMDEGKGRILSRGELNPLPSHNCGLWTILGTTAQRQGLTVHVQNVLRGVGALRCRSEGQRVLVASAA